MKRLGDLDGMLVLTSPRLTNQPGKQTTKSTQLASWPVGQSVGWSVGQTIPCARVTHAVSIVTICSQLHQKWTLQEKVHFTNMYII